MWKLVIQVVLALSRNPKVQAWAKRKAVEVISGIRKDSDKKIAEIAALVE